MDENRTIRFEWAWHEIWICDCLCLEHKQHVEWVYKWPVSDTLYLGSDGLLFLFHRTQIINIQGAKVHPDVHPTLIKVSYLTTPLLSSQYGYVWDAMISQLSSFISIYGIKEYPVSSLWVCIGWIVDTYGIKWHFHSVQHRWVWGEGPFFLVHNRYIGDEITSLFLFHNEDAYDEDTPISHFMMVMYGVKWHFLSIHYVLYGMKRHLFSVHFGVMWYNDISSQFNMVYMERISTPLFSMVSIGCKDIKGPLFSTVSWTGILFQSLWLYMGWSSLYIISIYRLNRL